MRECAVTMLVRVGVFVRVIVHVEFHAADAHLLPARHVQMPAFELELLQLPLQRARVNPQINQRADKHIAADAAEEVQVKLFHEGRFRCERDPIALPRLVN